MSQLSMYSLFNKNNAFSYYPTCTKFKRWKVLEICFVCMKIKKKKYSDILALSNSNIVISISFDLGLA